MFSTILFAPLVGALLAGFASRPLSERGAMLVSTGLLFLSCLLSWVVFLTFDPEAARTLTIARWIDSGTMTVDWAIRVDRLTSVMLVVVTSVSALVHLYSMGYMHVDEGRPRFFAYLSFFTFAMLMLVTADNLAQMFFGWEGVGVASYLLIGFYYHKDSANRAAMKAFIVNRVGDFGFALGIFALFLMVDSIQFDDVFAAAPELAEQSFRFLGMEVNAAETIAVLLFIGAMGKSAQLFLHTWLPDAMEGPTPVSALIHAATMVTAGVFLCARMSPLFEYAPNAMVLVTLIGAATAFFAATVGLVQNDIKRVIAYSTCSQLGYMFVAIGVGVYQAAMFHLFTHAFFKALLFLGAGSVIHAMHHEQDMRKMGGLKGKLPMTFAMMMIGTLAITGVGVPLLYILDTPIGLAGFVSKDVIIESSYAAQSAVSGLAFALLVIAAGFTSFYSWRLIFLTFYGETRADADAYGHAHESPNVMLVPLYLLAIGAALAGMEFYPDFVGHHQADWWGASIFTAEANHVLHDSHDVPAWVKVSPFVAMILGLAVALQFYMVDRTLPQQFATRHAALYDFLLNKWYFDELYDRIFVKPAMALGRFFWKKGDGATIDGAINGVAMGAVPWVTRMAGRAQSGFIFHYAFVMLLGISVLVTWLSVMGG